MVRFWSQRCYQRCKRIDVCELMIHVCWWERKWQKMEFSPCFFIHALLWRNYLTDLKVCFHWILVKNCPNFSRIEITFLFLDKKLISESVKKKKKTRYADLTINLFYAAQIHLCEYQNMHQKKKQSWFICLFILCLYNISCEKAAKNRSRWFGKILRFPDQKLSLSPPGGWK